MTFFYHQGIKSGVQRLIRKRQKMLKPINSYRHLKPEDRMNIAGIEQQIFSKRKTAELIGCLAITISRELVRNEKGKTYDRQSTQCASQHRRIAFCPPRKLHT